MATLPSAESIFAASQKIALTRGTFVAHILPPFVCQYLMGVLVQLDGTRFYRIAFLPVIFWLTWRGAFVDMSGGDPKQNQMNTGLMTQMCSISMRCTVWAVARERFRRLNPSKKQNESDSENIYTAFWNAWDLLLNVRGVGWNWPRGLVFPKPLFETDSRTIFVSLSILYVVLNVLAFDVCLQTLRLFSPDAFGSLDGGSLFDHTLPPFLELSRVLFLSFLVVWMTYFMIQWCYQALAIVSVILFQQYPSQWPPLFDSPWLSTSLTEFWGRRWHQLMRDLVVNLGMLPFGFLFGRLGGLFAAFFISGLFHDFELRSFGRGGNSVLVAGFWVMSGLGVILEHVWKKMTGRRVGGVLGRVWMLGWLALWGVPVVNEWAKAGRFGGLSLPGDIEPSRALVEMVWRWVHSYM